MVTEKTARAVSLKEFGDFIKDNLHLTWYLGEGGCFSKTGSDKDGWSAIKYFYPNIDTRTMDIWRIKTDKFEVDHTEEFDGTILDLLLHKINEYKKGWDE